MTKLTKVEPVETPAPQSEPAAVLSMIDRVLANPNIPVERIEQLFELHRRVQREQARKDFAIAMVAAQGKMQQVAAEAWNPQTKSKYATYDALDRAIRPAYTSEGFAVSYNTEPSALPDHLMVVAYVTHVSGFEREYRIDMPADGKGAKGGDVMTKTHAMGAAFSYGKRYLLGSIFNVATIVKKDDDGNSASQLTGTITEAQYKVIADLIKRTNTDLEQFLSIGGLEALSDMPANKFASAKAMLEKKFQNRVQS